MHPSFSGLKGETTEGGFLRCSLSDVYEHARPLLLRRDWQNANPSAADTDAFVQDMHILSRLAMKRDAGWNKVVLNPQRLFVSELQRELTLER